MDNLKQELTAANISFKENINLGEHTTMGAKANASIYLEVTAAEQLVQIFQVLNNHKDIKWMVLGGGSNTIFINDYEGVIIHNAIMGKEIIDKDDMHIRVRIGAGEDWHEFVKYAVENEWQGIENLALIPGTVGAAPVQNLAAYGQNLQEVFESLEAFNIESGEIEALYADKLEFGYRSSAFKTHLKGKYIITSVTLKLNLNNYSFETSYHARKARHESLADAFEAIGAKQPYNIKNVFDAVVYLRERKLPKVSEWGTVGSFFVNPMVTNQKFKELSELIPELQSYPVEDLSYRIKDWKDIKDDYVKIPAGRLLDDELGWRGKWEGNVGTFDKHALCVITNKKASGKEILDFTNKMRQSVMDAYGIELESEVNMIE